MRLHSQEQRLELSTTSPLASFTSFRSSKAEANVVSLPPPPLRGAGSAYWSVTEKYPANCYVACPQLMTSHLLTHPIYNLI